MSRLSTILLLGLIFAGLFPRRIGAQDNDLAKASRLTVEQATELLKRPGTLYLAISELSPDTASVLSRHKGWILLPRLTSLSPAAAKALSPLKGKLSLPALKELPPDVANALAPHAGMLDIEGVKSLSDASAAALAKHVGEVSLQLQIGELSPELAAILSQFRGQISLSNLTSLSPAAAKALAPGKSKLALVIKDVPGPEISAEVAEILASYSGELHVGGLTKLTSLPLARKLGQNCVVYMGNMTGISAEIARALCPPVDRTGTSRENRGLQLTIRELPAEVAKAFAVRQGGEIKLHELSKLSDEAAAAFEGYNGQLTLYVSELSPAAAKSLASVKRVVFFVLNQLSPEAELALAASKGCMEPEGLRRVNTGPLAVRLVDITAFNSVPFGHDHMRAWGLKRCEYLSAEAALALANASDKQVPLEGLKELTSVPLAAKLAAIHPNLELTKLTEISDDVAKALSKHKGKLNLSGLKSLSTEAAKALANHEGELMLDGIQTLSAEADKALRANPGISLPAKK
jgi:hypothetical protein